MQYIIVGIGGQGILFAGKVLGAVALEKKQRVTGSEVHGMAQRGGSVISHFKTGDFISPLVRAGEADVLLAFDQNEGIRNLHFLREGGAFVVNVHDRSAFDKIQVAGGFISVNTGSAPEANTISVKKKNADEAFDSAICIGCGACVAACKNASAMLFVSAKISQFALLPQGRVEAKERVRAMVEKMDELGFGNCSNTGACEAECPKQIKLDNIARLNREYYKAY